MRISTLVYVMLWSNSIQFDKVNANPSKVLLWNLTDWLFCTDKDERHSTGRKLVRTEGYFNGNFLPIYYYLVFSLSLTAPVSTTGSLSISVFFYPFQSFSVPLYLWWLISKACRVHRPLAANARSYNPPTAGLCRTIYFKPCTCLLFYDF